MPRGEEKASHAEERVHGRKRHRMRVEKEGHVGGNEGITCLLLYQEVPNLESAPFETGREREERGKEKKKAEHPEPGSRAFRTWRRHLCTSIHDPGSFSLIHNASTALCSFSFFFLPCLIFLPDPSSALFCSAHSFALLCFAHPFALLCIAHCSALLLPLFSAPSFLYTTGLLCSAVLLMLCECMSGALLRDERLIYYF